MRIIGLTGGIASGKSTVRGMLEALGAPVEDADAIYHALIQPWEGKPSPLAARIGEAFPEALNPTGSIDRKSLGERVFADTEARQRLEAITHPAVAEETARRMHQLAGRGHQVAIYDVPLLFERGLDKTLSGVIVVWVPQAVQLQRLMARDGLSENEAHQRIDAQMPLADKKTRADWVVDNSGTPEQTRAQVERIWREVNPAAARL